MKKLQTDKILHFLAGISITAIFGIFLGSIAGFFFGIAAGIGKEIYDKRSYGDFNVQDFYFTVLGSGLMAVLIAIAYDSYELTQWLTILS